MSQNRREKTEKKRIRKTEARWREVIAARCGGANFDDPGTGYAFSEILRKESLLKRLNMPGDPTSALLTLSIADPTHKMHPGAMDAAMAYYKFCPDATRYTDNSGVRICLEAGIEKTTHEYLADYLNKRFKCRVNKKWVQYLPGSIKHALSTIISSLLFDRDGILIFPTPGYTVIKNEVNRREIRVEDAPMIYSDGRWDFNLRSLPIMWHGRKVFMYVNIPENPTSTGYDRIRWKKLLAWAEENRVTLIVDEAYIDLCYNPRCVSVLTIPGWEKSCIVLQSVSKGYDATGLRIGWAVGYPTIIKAMSSKVTDCNDSGSYGPNIAAALHLLKHPEYTQIARSRYLRLHELLYAGLSSVGFQTNMPDAGLCQFTPAPRAANGKSFETVFDCEDWFRKKLRISLMPHMVGTDPWLRWAVTLKPVPECRLTDEEAVITEAVRRLKNVKFSF
jgi:aspartate/methionine/tyrosine aminotransferase